MRDRQQARLAADHQLVRRDDDGQLLAVAAHQFGLEVVAIAVAAQQLDQRTAIGRAFPDANLGRRPADHFVARPAVSSRKTVIDIRVPAVGQARDGDRTGAEAKRRAVALFIHEAARLRCSSATCNSSRFARAPVVQQSARRIVTCVRRRDQRIRGGKSTHSSTSHAQCHREPAQSIRADRSSTDATFRAN